MSETRRFLAFFFRAVMLMAAFSVFWSLGCEVDAGEMGGNAVSTVKDVGRKVGPGSSGRDVLALTDELDRLDDEMGEIKVTLFHLGGGENPVPINQRRELEAARERESALRAVIDRKCAEYVVKGRDQLEKWELEWQDKEHELILGAYEKPSWRADKREEMREINARAVRVDDMVVYCGGKARDPGLAGVGGWLRR